MKVDAKVVLPVIGRQQDLWSHAARVGRKQDSQNNSSLES